MSAAPSLGIPELAGLADYATASRLGIGVDENVRRLLRYQWAERRLMLALVSHLPAEPVWEVKGGMARHQWQDAEHVDWLRGRIGEMRHPVPTLDAAPDGALDAFFDEVLRSHDTVELLAGTYGVARAAVAEAYRRHLAETNPLVDQPTCRLLGFALQDHEDALRWAAAALAALTARDPDAARRAADWQVHLRGWLAAAGGIAGPAPAGAAPPTPRTGAPYVPDWHPRRDARFGGQYEFDFPPHVLYQDPRVPADERNLALLCKRTLEMDVPEMIASVIVERPEQPWAFHLEYARQLWDEMRHAMMGSVAFEARGVDWTCLPLNVGFALRLNLHASALDRQTILYAIEQSLMPAATGKRSEYDTAVAAGDALSALFHDYDWADEVLHARIGRRWMRHEGIGTEQALERAATIHERTWEALAAYRPDAPGPEWWDPFVRRVLGRPSAVAPADREALRIIAE